MEQTRPPIRQAPLSVILLATTPEPVDSLVEAWLPFVEQAPAGSQLIAIADRSMENLAPHAQLRVVRHAQPMGFGASLQTGLWSLETPLVLFAPADGSLSPEQAGAFLERIDQADLVVGCRRFGPTPVLVRTWGFLRRTVARVFLGYTPEPRFAWPGWSGWRQRWVARHLFGVPLLDPESGVLLARSEIFARIPIQSTGSFAWIEMVAKANHLGCLLDEVAVEAKPRAAEAFARDAWRIFRRPDFGRA